MKIVFAEPLEVSENSLKQIKKYFEDMGHTLEYYTDRNEAPEEIIKRSGDAEILTISNIPVTSYIIENCKNLKFINVAFTGVDLVDMEACKKHGISVSNASGYATVAVAELTLALALSLLRNITGMDKETRQLKGRDKYLGTELQGKTVGIVGTGSIGLKVAGIFHLLGCNIIAYNRTPKTHDFIKYVSLEEVFSSSDIITLHIPSNKETENMINEQLLSKMKSTSILINTARGQIIDYKALGRMLTDNKIAGAGIDVYEKEPPLPSDHPLLKAPNTVLLPHIAYATKESMIKRLEIVKQNILSFINGDQQNKII